MGKYGMTDVYKENLHKGTEYEDFVCDSLREKYGIIIQTYSSRKYQNEKGESAGGYEIKFDNLVSETGNLYFEVAEKSDLSLPEYSRSGIFRKDNTWLYLIGNHEYLWAFSKRQLRILYQSPKSWDAHKIKKKQTPTSIGFVLPVKEAEKWLCVYRFNLSEVKK